MVRDPPCRNTLYLQVFWYSNLVNLCKFINQSQPNNTPRSPRSTEAVEQRESLGGHMFHSGLINETWMDEIVKFEEKNPKNADVCFFTCVKFSDMIICLLCIRYVCIVHTYI